MHISSGNNFTAVKSFAEVLTLIISLSDINFSFSPAQIMPLLEIVHTPKTSPEIIADLMNVAAKIQKIPVTVRNCTGFAVTRMLFPCTQSALFLADHGLDIYRIDNAITKFGMQMGPFRYQRS